ncbi:MAG: hypothetical protein WD081_08985 [Gammaproteobacteria bacterium]
MSTRTYPVAPLRKVSLATFAVILALLPLGVLVAFSTGRIEPDGLRIAQAFFLTLMPFAILIPALRRREVIFDGETLTVKAAFHTRRRRVPDLDVTAARIVDLNEEKALRPIFRRFGFSLIGFHAGHYRLWGLKKAFALITTCERVLALPERDGTLLLMSLERPQQLIDALQTEGVRTKYRIRQVTDA